jgi:hypothetical protein
MLHRRGRIDTYHLPGTDSPDSGQFVTPPFASAALAFVPQATFAVSALTGPMNRVKYWQTQ